MTIFGLPAIFGGGCGTASFWLLIQKHVPNHFFTVKVLHIDPHLHFGPFPMFAPLKEICYIRSFSGLGGIFRLARNPSLLNDLTGSVLVSHVHAPKSRRQCSVTFMPRLEPTLTAWTILQS